MAVVLWCSICVGKLVVTVSQPPQQQSTKHRKSDQAPHITPAATTTVSRKPYDINFIEPISTTSQSHIIFSPNKNKKVYLEKEYDKSIRRFVRQTAILEDLRTRQKKILKEQSLSSRDAIASYSDAKGNCYEPSTLCSEINHDIFIPKSWINDNAFMLDTAIGNFEEDGAHVIISYLYNAKGEELLNDKLKKQLDYKTSEHKFEGFTVSNAYLATSGQGMALVLEKNIFGGYSIVYLSKNNQIISQYLANDNTAGFLNRELRDCKNILSESWVNKYFTKR